MSDQSAHKPPAQPTPATPAPAKGTGASTNKHGQLKAPGLTMVQQLGIWVLVVVVGLLFGMGPTFGMIGQHSHEDVTRIEINQRMTLARKLQDAINPRRYPMKPDGSDMFEKDPYSSGVPAEQQWQFEMQQAQTATERGLLPSGEVLKQIVKAFLNEPLDDGSGRRYVDALHEVQGGDKEITEEELSKFLAERTASELLQARTVVAPALPLQIITDDVREYLNDKVTVDELVLSCEHLLPKIADNDPEIQIAYDKLRSERFRQPATCVVTVAYGDVKALSFKVVVTQAEIEKYYNENKETFKKPDAPVAKPVPKPGAAPGDKTPVKAADAPKPVPQYKTLSEVTEEIREILKQQAAKKQGSEMVQAFNDSPANADLLSQKDNKGFKEAALKAGLAVKDGIVIQTPERSATQLKVDDLGELSETELRLFSQEPNFISTPIQTSGAHPIWLLLRLDEKRDASYKELKDPVVKAEVIEYLRGQRAYKELLVAAEAARASAEKLGVGGLKIYANSAAGKIWKAKVETKTLNANEDISAPPATLERMQSGEPRQLISLNTPSAPVMLAKDDAGKSDKSELPRVKLVQVIGFTPGEAFKSDDMARYISAMRGLLAQYREHLAAEEQRIQGR